MTCLVFDSQREFGPKKNTSAQRSARANQALNAAKSSYRKRHTRDRVLNYASAYTRFTRAIKGLIFQAGMRLAVVVAVAGNDYANNPRGVGFKKALQYGESIRHYRSRYYSGPSHGKKRTDRVKKKASQEKRERGSSSRILNIPDDPDVAKLRNYKSTSKNLSLGPDGELVAVHPMSRATSTWTAGLASSVLSAAHRRHPEYVDLAVSQARAITSAVRGEVDTTNVLRRAALRMARIALHSVATSSVYTLEAKRHIYKNFFQSTRCQSIEETFSTNVGQIFGSRAVRFIGILRPKDVVVDHFHGDKLWRYSHKQSEWSSQRLLLGGCPCVGHSSNNRQSE
ncbi:hypothetical protein BCR43DRAFT_551386 [Syncephalastrum racemosum]|uniref:Uncharacterized protein n=1 Tax=Syncephalastrum racemosum TaxID=13706 RepID=A0A1X2H5H7_SYNRA|nr:hypothetical protein BCR43DRAFT_551386 [Syncephalastrum racemosum]